MANELDELMDLDPLELSSRPGGIDAVIAYHRQRRADAEAGIKPKREQGPTKKIDLLALGLKKPSEPMKRRV